MKHCSRFPGGPTPSHLKSLLEDPMLTRSIPLLAVALVVAAAPALSAQTSVALSQRSRPVYDAVTIGGAFGGLSGAANLNQAGTADWRLGGAASPNATGWLNDYVGGRARAGWGQGTRPGGAP